MTNDIATAIAATLDIIADMVVVAIVAPPVRFPAGTPSVWRLQGCWTGSYVLGLLSDLSYPYTRSFRNIQDNGYMGKSLVGNYPQHTTLLL